MLISVATLIFAPVTYPIASNLLQSCNRQSKLKIMTNTNKYPKLRITGAEQRQKRNIALRKDYDRMMERDCTLKVKDAVKRLMKKYKLVGERTVYLILKNTNL